ncbi:MAG: BON domain-containing protein, partial [Alphaproteobacteria bacterium]
VRTQLLFTSGVAASNYKLTMENGVIYIMGISENQAELDIVIAVIKETPGVQKVVPLTRFKNDE